MALSFHDFVFYSQVTFCSIKHFKYDGNNNNNNNPCEVDPCHHGMARPLVADGGMASDMEGSCE
jgi:hypothetical protein